DHRIMECDREILLEAADRRAAPDELRNAPMRKERQLAYARLQPALSHIVAECVAWSRTLMRHHQQANRQTAIRQSLDGLQQRPPPFRASELSVDADIGQSGIEISEQHALEVCVMSSGNLCPQQLDIQRRTVRREDITKLHMSLPIVRNSRGIDPGLDH